MSVSGVAQIFSTEYVTFTTLIFIHALGTSGVYPLAFILGNKQHKANSKHKQENNLSLFGWF